MEYQHNETILTIKERLLKCISDMAPGEVFCMCVGDDLKHLMEYYDKVFERSHPSKAETISALTNLKFADSTDYAGTAIVDSHDIAVLLRVYRAQCIMSAMHKHQVSCLKAKLGI